MSNFPYSFEALNMYNGHISPSGRVQNDQTTFWYWRSLYHRLLSIFRFRLPEGWNKRYFENVLYCCGYIGIIETDKYGVIPQLCTPSGYGLYLQPTEILVAQPLVNFRGTIGKDCELFMLTPDFLGVLDIVDHFAKQLSSVYTSFMASSEVSRAGLLAYAKNKSAAETLKVIGEKISSGEPLVVVGKEVKQNMDENDPLFMQAFDVKYIGPQLLSDLQTVLNSFDREIGFPVIDEKKERRIVSEVDATTSGSGSRITTWKEQLDDSIDRVRGLFGVEIGYDCTVDDLQPQAMPEEGVTE